MALIGINSVSRGERKKDTLDRILEGVQLAQGVLGLGLQIPEYLAKRDALSAQNAATKRTVERDDLKTTLDVETKTRPAEPSDGPREFGKERPLEPGAFKLGSFGDRVLRSSGVGLDEQIKILRLNELLSKNTPLDSEGAAALSRITGEPASFFEGKRGNDPVINQLISAGRAQSSQNIARESLDIRKESAEIRKGEVSRREQENLDAKIVPGVGIAYSAGDAKELKDATKQKEIFDSKAKEMIDLRTEFGFNITNRAAVARGRQLSKELLLAYKQLAKLGVLSKADESLVAKIIPEDPLSFAFQGTGGDPIIHTLKKFREDTEDDYAATVKLRIKTPETSLNVPGSIDNTVTIEFKGQVLTIPEKDLDQAVKDGAKRIK